MQKLFRTFKNSFPWSHVCLLPYATEHPREEPASAFPPPNALEERQTALENSPQTPPRASLTEDEEAQLRQQTDARERGLLAAPRRPQA